ncbi:uncharacterized protein LOC131592714 isoform X2 [Poecile atricapillus]|uniref:uncharacterized protein LOC131592714 isoform X2 n=1 Tax=Poecile atricapillus TaxID=48891 RepID=UPI00273974E8|nr:uncharacterized protein LOC131592714 isoform X2 [Poecile atricapillus]
MEAAGIPGRGWGSPMGRPARYSTGTRELVRATMEELHLTHSQKRYLMDYVKRGDALPLQRFPPSSKQPVHVSYPAACQPCRLPARPLLRPAKVCQAEDAYTREKFKPQPIRKSVNIANKSMVMPGASQPLFPSCPSPASISAVAVYLNCSMSSHSRSSKMLQKWISEGASAEIWKRRREDFKTS